MPVHYDPARIRKRFCPRGHDKYVVGVHTSDSCINPPHQCYACHKQVNRKQNSLNPNKRFSNSIGRYKRKLRERIVVKEQRIAELEEFLSVQEK